MRAKIKSVRKTNEIFLCIFSYILNNWPFFPHTSIFTKNVFRLFSKLNIIYIQKLCPRFYDNLELPSQRTKEMKNCSSSERPCRTVFSLSWCRHSADQLIRITQYALLSNKILLWIYQYYVFMNYIKNLQIYEKN